MSTIRDYSAYNDCLIKVWNTTLDPQTGEEIETPKKVENESYIITEKGYILLQGIPSEYYKVRIDNMLEVTRKVELAENEYQVDYVLGLIRFNPNLKFKKIIIKEYMCRGFYYYPSARILYKYNPITNEIVTMEDIIWKIEQDLRLVTENAKEQNTILNQTITTGNQTDTTLKEAIDLARKLITELGVDQYVKHADTGNETGKIPINNGTMNINLNAEMVGGKKVGELANSIHTHTKSEITDFPIKLPADGGDSSTVGGRTPESFANTVHTHKKADITDMSLKSVAETGDYNDLTNKPTSLPANGGNADTVDGKSSEDFMQNTDSTNILKMKYDTKKQAVTVNKNDETDTLYMEKAKVADVALETNILGGLESDGYGKQTTQDMDFYVDVNNGNNTNDGSLLKPFKTIQYALDSCPKFIRHDIRIHIANGEYHENIITGGFLGIGTIRMMADTSDYSLVKIKGVFRNFSSHCRFFTCSSVSFIPDPILISDFVEIGNGGKQNLFLLKIEGGMNTVIENCYIYQTGLSMDYLYGIYFNYSPSGRVKNTILRDMKGKIRGVGIMADNGSEVFCLNCDVNGTTYCYYTQAGTIRVYNPILPSDLEKDYTELKRADIDGSAY